MEYVLYKDIFFNGVFIVNVKYYICVFFIQKFYILMMIKKFVNLVDFKINRIVNFFRLKMFGISLNLKKLCYYYVFINMLLYYCECFVFQRLFFIFVVYQNLWFCMEVCVLKNFLYYYCLLLFFEICNYMVIIYF